MPPAATLPPNPPADPTGAAGIPDWPFPAGEEAAAANPSGLDDVYQGPTPWEIQGADAAAPPPGRTARSLETARKAVLTREDVEIETFLTRNIPLAIVAAGILFLVTQAFSSSQILGVYNDPGKAAVRFFELTGEDLPGVAAGAAGLTAAGHEFVYLEQPLDEEEGSPRLTAVLYRRGALAGSASEEELARIGNRLIAELPVTLYGIPERRLTIAGEPVRGHMMGYTIADEPRRVVSIVIPEEDGRPVLMLLAGSTPLVENALREMR